MTETIEGAKELARVYMSKNLPVYVEGPPGVGKSQMFKQLADEQKIGFIDLRLAQMDPVDLRGLPTITNNMTTWSRPDFWPTEERDGPKGILLLDELGDCGKAMQSAAYQIILEGQAGPHVIPKGWFRCGAGNRMKDKAGAQSMSTALANRFKWIEVDADVKCFLEYGAKVGLHHFVMGFVQFRPGLLHSMEGASLKAFPTPRSWADASKVCDADKTLRMRLIGGCVGEGPAGEFENYLKALDLPDFEDIIKDPKHTHIPVEPSSRYALGAMLSRFADKKNFGAIMQYVTRKEFGRDFEICVVLDATKRDAALTETKPFTDFALRNNDLALG